MFQLIVNASVWPTGSFIGESAMVPCRMALRGAIRRWRRFAQLEDNFVLGMRIVERDLAHEADMRALKREQLRADVADDDAALMDALDDYEF